MINAAVEQLVSHQYDVTSSKYLGRLQWRPDSTTNYHEVSHVKVLRCTFPSCQYPSFSSLHSLKNHVRKYHEESGFRNASANGPELTAASSYAAATADTVFSANNNSSNITIIKYAVSSRLRVLLHSSPVC
jgi:hypothetical protein